MQLTDRNLNTSFYDANGGGDPLQYQHQFCPLFSPRGHYKFIPRESTKREIFQLELVQKELKERGINIKNEWLEWLIGFMEGDGCFLFSSRKNLSMIITQGEDNVEQLYKIQKTQNMGRVIKQGPRVYRWIVEVREDLLIQVKLFNGNLIQDSRRKQLKKFIEEINNKLKKHGKKEIEYNTNRPAISLNTGWLLGFTEAEGCFTISILTNSKAFRTRFIQTQKGSEPLPIFSKLIELFNGGVIEKHSKKDIYNYILTGINKIYNCYIYFDKFEYLFQGNKLKSYQAFKIQNEKLLNKEHLDPEKRENQKQLSQKINNYRRKSK